MYSDSPPAPDSPFLIQAKSNSITIGWPEVPCDGGHPLSGFMVEYFDIVKYYTGYLCDFGSGLYLPCEVYETTYHHIRDISLASRNYTIDGLWADTEYTFRIKALSVDSMDSDYSRQITFSTLPPCKLYIVTSYKYQIYHLHNPLKLPLLHVKCLFDWLDHSWLR